MAENLKDIWSNFKQDIKTGNAKVKADHQQRASTIEKPRMDTTTSGTKKAFALWGFVLTLPFLLFAIVLFIFGVLILWSIF